MHWLWIGMLVTFGVAAGCGALCLAFVLLGILWEEVLEPHPAVLAALAALCGFSVVGYCVWRVFLH